MRGYRNGLPLTVALAALTGVEVRLGEHEIGSRTRTKNAPLLGSCAGVSGAEYLHITLHYTGLWALRIGHGKRKEGRAGLTE
jgi:hypothetical protein